MAHIPQDARYVDPPSEREVDEDAVTEYAMDMVEPAGECPCCGMCLPYDHTDAEWEQFVDRHAKSCEVLRLTAEDRLYGEAE